MSHHQIAYEDIIRAAGHRVTPQRIRILDAVCDGGQHTTLGQIFARVRKYDKKLNKSTVYRTLKLLVDLKLIVHADTGDGESYYEIVLSTPHHHLICEKCHQEIEVAHALVEPLFERIQEEYGYHVNTQHLVLQGICKACLR